MVIKLSDLLFGKKEIIPGLYIWNEEYADAAEVKLYPQYPEYDMWLFWIIGEEPYNHIYTICERCGRTAVERDFSENSVQPSLDHLFCFHCNQILKEGESDE